MSPLMVRILAGLEDARLLEIIDQLLAIHNGGGNGLSDGERALYYAAWDRLDAITK